MACRAYAASPSEAYALHLHLADAFILTLHSSYSFYILSALASLGIEPMILALLAPCSTSWATGKLISEVVLHCFEGRLMSEPRVLAAAGHRCAATASSTGGERTYRWAFVPSTWEKMACVLEWMRADWGADHVFTSCSCTSEKKGPTSSSQLYVWTWNTMSQAYSWQALLEDSRLDRTLMSSWRSEGPELSVWSGSDPA